MGNLFWKSFRNNFFFNYYYLNCFYHKMNFHGNVWKRSTKPTQPQKGNEPYFFYGYRIRETMIFDESNYKILDQNL